MESGEKDLLSKQAILNLPRDKEFNLEGKLLAEYVNVKDIEALPTVQSQSTAGQLNDSAQSTNLIDRQQAIDAIHCNIVVTGRENAELVAKTMGEFVDRIKALPTIQPVATDTNVGSNSEIPNNSDCISRQAAIEAIEKNACNTQRSIDAINGLPPAQPTGRWIYRRGMNEQCSVCGQYFPLSYFNDRPFDIKYCPHCGAHMKGERLK